MLELPSYLKDYTRNPNLDEQGVPQLKVWVNSLKNKLNIEEAELIGERPSWWWTSAYDSPEGCPGMDDNGSLSSLPQPNLLRINRKQVLDYFDNTWNLTEILFSSLQGELTFLLPPFHRLRHPLIFYYGHPAVLYVNKLRLAGLFDKPINAYYEQLFETGVDEMSWDDLSKNEMEWPTVKEVNQYRKNVYQKIRALILNHPDLDKDRSPITQSHPLWSLFLGFEHERIHLETSSILIRELPVDLVEFPKYWPSAHKSIPVTDIWNPKQNKDYPENEELVCAEKKIVLGKPHAWPSFGWDNEYGDRKTKTVGMFNAQRFMVSNGEYLEFVKRGGYQNQKYWSEDGWQWKNFRNAKWPTFWVAVGPQNLHQYRLRSIFTLHPMPWSWPAEVNFHEAKAYSAWKNETNKKHQNYRLITEVEHQSLLGKKNNDVTPDYSVDPVLNYGGDEMAEKGNCNLNLAYGSPTPVDQFSAGTTSHSDLLGNVWEWCEDDFYPLDGFKIHPIYDDFSTPCFDGLHNMILGGSFVSTGGEASMWARFHFRPHFHQHAGFRLAHSENNQSNSYGTKISGLTNQTRTNYEADNVLAQYLFLHYAESLSQKHFLVGSAINFDFPQKCARLLVEFCKKLQVATNSVADVGCAVGGTSFELARTFHQVIGIDLSKRFIEVATHLKTIGSYSFDLLLEGDVSEKVKAQVDSSIDRTRVQFKQADACALPPNLTGLDAALLINLVCRLPSPKACLNRLGGQFGLIRPGGLVLIASPFTWSEEYTPKEVWLGGYRLGSQTIDSREELIKQMKGNGFTLVHEEDSMLMIREHRRKFQYILPNLTLWKRDI